MSRFLELLTLLNEIERIRESPSFSPEEKASLAADLSQALPARRICSQALATYDLVLQRANELKDNANGTGPGRKTSSVPNPSRKANMAKATGKQVPKEVRKDASPAKPGTPDPVVESGPSIQSADTRQPQGRPRAEAGAYPRVSPKQSPGHQEPRKESRQEGS